MVCSSHAPAGFRRNLYSLTEGGVCVFVLGHKCSVCSSCSAESWLLVLQLWHPQHRGTSPRQSPWLREHQQSSSSSQSVPQHPQSIHKCLRD